MNAVVFCIEKIESSNISDCGHIQLAHRPINFETSLGILERGFVPGPLFPRDISAKSLIPDIL